MTHYSAELSHDLRHVLKRVDVVYTQQHCEAHDVWHIGTLVPAGETVLCVTDAQVDRTANYDACGKICLWHHVHAYLLENCSLFLD